MTESLASGLKKIQFTKSLGSQLPLREQIPPALIRSNNINSTPLTAVRGHGNTGNSASSETYLWKPSSSMPHSLSERSPVTKEIPSPFKMYPSPPIYPRPHTLPTKTKAKRAASSLGHSEDFGCELGSRYSGDGESICSSTEEGCVTMGVRPPPDGCFSDLSEDDEDVSGEDDYSDTGMKDDSFVDDDDSIFDNQSVGMDEMDELDGDVPCTSDDDSISNHSQHAVTVVHPVSASLPGQRKRIHLSNNSRRVTSSVDRDLPKHNSWVGRAISGPPIPLLPSLFCNVPPTIYFTTEGEAVAPFPTEIRRLLKWKLSTITPKVVKTCIAKSGFRITKKCSDWLGCWGKHMKASCFKELSEFQKLNHFPGTFQIGRKDRLWRNYSKMQVLHGKKEFNFAPQTYVLPHDFKLLKRHWETGPAKQKWIIKPPASARGIGIKVIHKWNQLPRKRSIIVQRYLSKPYLINGSKFDLRVYVYVPSFDPLRIYIFEDGLVRFATSKYSSSSKSLSNKYVHLTNYSINKKNTAAYTPNSDDKLCQGHKWSLKGLWGYFKKIGVNTSHLWDSIKDIVTKTILCCESSVGSLVKQNVRNRQSCHELFGFDIILDDHLKPWILEVNISPSLHSNSALDTNIKAQLVKDLFNIGGFRIPRSLMSTVSITRCSEYAEMTSGKYWFEARTLTSDERAKHAFYTQKHLDERAKSTILDVLTPDDIKILIETEDEHNRRGCFQRIFPSPTTDKYLRFFESAKYYSILLDEWNRKYRRDANRPNVGISLLYSYSQQGLHLENPPDRNHQWSASQAHASLGRSISAPATLLESDGNLKSFAVPSLPKIKKKRRDSKPESNSKTTSSSVSSNGSIIGASVPQHCINR